MSSSSHSQLSHIHCVTLPLIPSTSPSNRSLSLPLTCKLFSNTSNPLNFIWSVSVIRESLESGGSSTGEKQKKQPHYAAIVKKPEFLTIARKQISSQKQLYQIVRDALEGKMPSSLWYELYLVGADSELLAHIMHQREKQHAKQQNLNDSDVWNSSNLNLDETENDPFLSEMNLLHFPDQLDKLWDDKEYLVIRVIYDGEYTNMEFHVLLNYSDPSTPVKREENAKADDGGTPSRTVHTTSDTPLRSIQHNLPTSDSPKPDIASLSSSVGLLEQRRRERKLHTRVSPLPETLRAPEKKVEQVVESVTTTESDVGINVEEPRTTHKETFISQGSPERGLEELAERDGYASDEQLLHAHDIDTVEDYEQDKSLHEEDDAPQISKQSSEQVISHSSQEATADAQKVATSVVSDNSNAPPALRILNFDQISKTQASDDNNSNQTKTRTTNARSENHGPQTSLSHILDTEASHSDKMESQNSSQSQGEESTTVQSENSFSPPESPTRSHSAQPTRIVSSLSNSWTKSPRTPQSPKRKVPQSARTTVTTSRELKASDARQSGPFSARGSPKASSFSASESSLPQQHQFPQAGSHPYSPGQTPLDPQSPNMHYMPFFPPYLHPQHQISTNNEEVVNKVDDRLATAREMLTQEISVARREITLADQKTNERIDQMENTISDYLDTLEERVQKQAEEEMEGRLERFRKDLTAELHQSMNAKLNEGLERIEQGFTRQLDETQTELKKEIAEDLHAARMSERLHQFEENQKKNLKKVLWSIQQMQVDNKEHKENTESLSTEVDATQEELASQVLTMRKLSAAMKTLQKDQQESKKIMQHQITELTKSQSLLQAENESLKNLLKSNIEEAVKTSLKGMLAQKKSESGKKTRSFASSPMRRSAIERPDSYADIQKRTPQRSVSHQPSIPYSTSPVRERRESLDIPGGNDSPSTPSEISTNSNSTPYLELYRSRVDSYKKVLENQSSRRPASGSPMRARSRSSEGGS